MIDSERDLRLREITDNMTRAFHQEIEKLWNRDDVTEVKEEEYRYFATGVAIALMESTLISRRSQLMSHDFMKQMDT
jgi:hypothetical protein